MKGVQKWTNKKIKYRRYIKEYYDADTGEELNEEEFKNYVKIKTEYIKYYAGHIATTYARTSAIVTMSSLSRSTIGIRVV